MQASDQDRIDAIDALLPQIQCQRCEYPGCRPYAEALFRDQAPINRCAPGGTHTMQALAAHLQRPEEPLSETHLAFSQRPPQVARIDETACIGCVFCIRACPVDAIIGAPKQLHTVLSTDCTGCGLCLPECPMECITLEPSPPQTATEIKERSEKARLHFKRHQKRLSAPPPPPTIEDLSAALDRARIKRIFTRLQRANPQPRTELHYTSTFELLVAVLLSAQTTDIRVNLVTPLLFQQAPTPQALYALGEASVKTLIRGIGLYQTKAKHLIQTAKILCEQHAGQVPSTREALEALPGVGRKTTNVILNTAFGQPTLAVDTHIFRVSRRLGLSTGKTPLAVEHDLLQKIPSPFQKNAHHWLVLHGRYTCTARRPHCDRCLLSDICPKKL